nr:hypothetical protein [Gemmatimonadota bacterium]
MITWLVALLAGALAAGVQYGRKAFAPGTLPIALLRGIGAMLVVALLLSAKAGRATSEAADVALDASESWTRASDAAGWKAALDSAAAAGHQVHRFGDSLRASSGAEPPGDHASRVRDVVDAASGSGRPVAIVTDGELDEPEVLAGLPRGSRTIVIPKREGSDAAVSTLESPRALLAGDTMTARVTIVSGAAGSGAGVVELRLDGTVLDTVAFAPLRAYTE